MVAMFLGAGGEFLWRDGVMQSSWAAMMMEQLVAKAGATWLTAATQGSQEFKKKIVCQLSFKGPNTHARQLDSFIHSQKERKKNQRIQ